jgi:RNA polymerase sigma factor (TIGR02999 family)
MGSEENTQKLTAREVTRLLKAWNEGDPLAPEKLVPLIYAELRRLARRSMRRENTQHTLETGALINEAYMRLADWKNARWENRAHFFGVAAQIMRRVLVDHARAHAYQKRGAGVRPLPLEEAIVASPDRAPNLIALDEALERLARRDPRKSKVVELRFFGGLSVEETAAVLNVSTITVMRDWNFVKAWLSREMKPAH